MYLVAIKFTHYGAKSQESGIKEWIVANDMIQAALYVQKVYDDGLFRNDDSKENGPATASFVVSLNDALADAARLRLPALSEFPTLSQTTDDLFIEVSGPMRDLVCWFQGNDFIEPGDTYYGTTQYNWCTYREVDSREAQLLVELGVAKYASDICTK